MPAGGPGKGHGNSRHAALQLARDRDPRIQVPPGSSPGDDDAGRRHASGFAMAIESACVPPFADDVCCDTLSKIAIPIRLMSSDEPPALTNGSGMPLVGASPSPR